MLCLWVVEITDARGRTVCRLLWEHRRNAELCAEEWRGRGFKVYCWRL